jgi:hypothetical protein
VLEGTAEPAEAGGGMMALQEKDVARAISDFMEYKGWRRFRNNVGVAMNPSGGLHRYGEKGMPDLLFVRYAPKYRPWTLMIWVETKRPRGRLSPHQEKWQEEETAAGAVIVTVNSFEDFLDWYNQTLAAIHTASGPDIPGNLDLFASNPGARS